ncbi:hypothetical protein MC7420_6431 [Coleofasciculus chthonoplastes PCC 7420]|uniref:Transposase IS4-like domain-containing protein n=1 Tax=Coleofasciculus chthonoplastes PCC 7420 TaxID=118168 RepID=B4VR01_9CYAN|nr:hypothetical protein MC7420_6431 [Coleofasciculus chthonoplastes PCC 7420]
MQQAKSSKARYSKGFIFENCHNLNRIAISLKATHIFQVEMKSVHIDGSSISVEGEYETKEKSSETIEGKDQEVEPEMKAIEIVHGYSRDKRPDLKQFIIDMIVTGDGDVPLYLKVDSGNVDDKSVFVERLKEFKKQWTFSGIYVGDSALYTADNLSAMRGMKWITRVPLSVKEAKNKIVEIEDNEWEESQIKGYKMAERESEYGGIKQRWVVVESEARKKARIKQIDKHIEKQEEKAQASVRKIYRQLFACKDDAEKAIKTLSNSWKYHQIKEIECREKRVKQTVEKRQKNFYQISGQVERRESVIEAEKIKAGRFILATNILYKNEASNQEILEEYKGQQSNERGFRFIKDPLFFTSSVFVKNPQRVEAIAMIMGLCLLVYNLAQRKLRQELAAANEAVKNQVKKLTGRPTMRWIFQMFQAVHLVTVEGEKYVNNLTSERQHILKHLGKYCREYYLIIEDG